MKLLLQEKNKLITYNLPNIIEGSFNIYNSKKVNIINIEAINGKWNLVSNVETKIIKNVDNNNNELLSNINQIEKLELNNFESVNILETISNEMYKIFVLPTYDNTFIQYVVDYNEIKTLTFGNDKNQMIVCNIPTFSKKQIEITHENNILYIKNLNTNVPMFINNILETESQIYNGDMIFIDGLLFTITGNILIINNPNNSININSLKIKKRLLPNNPNKEYITDSEVFVEAFDRNQYFQRPPRFKRIIEEKEFNIDPPINNVDNNEEMPLIYTMGPVILMGLTSIMSGFNAISNVMSGQSTLKENMVQIIMTFSMLGSMIVFPFLQKLYTRKSKNKKQKKIQKKYKKYIDKKRDEVLKEKEQQKQILLENYQDLDHVAKVIINKDRTLWDRKLEHPDFLNIRLGLGNIKTKININYPEEHFTLEETNLDEIYNELFEAVRDIEDVPVTINLIEKQFTGIVGNPSISKKFIDGILLQIMASHSYDMLKIVVISSNDKKNQWEKYRSIPHFWNNEKSIRYIGIDIDDINKVSNALIQIYNERVNHFEEEPQDTALYKDFKEYYLIISDELDYLKSTSIFNELIKCKYNYGFSMLMITEKLDSLPNECATFINIDNNSAGLFENELMSTNQISFKPDIPNFNMNLCYLSLCNIPIDVDAGKFKLPLTYSFLEMYGVGKISQLNIGTRWKENDILTTLTAPVGINEQGELFKIDLHEKAHGPHGLVAGMTGSGKSEWIITYILSMAINYHPNEVQFVLIDYKGGGLAGTFENKETGVKLPHLVGTITNLDITEINRSLASINSELKRRQTLFNQARDKLGESSVDIYKYQKWYREGKINTPISHLFIISDEFAELKAQQPEFMAELISTARIGRSLGVHLILATQKPSGVVDEQIWSNSKFRVCLKVQDKSDSNDMIRVPDAAYIKETGRFILQVGYNEFFAKGQSAYAGMPYYESDKHKNVIDTNISFVKPTGEIYKESNSQKKSTNAIFKGEELPNILNAIINEAKKNNLQVKQLWLDSLPDKIYINDLLKKYEYRKEMFILNPIIGEYDNPYNQSQNLLTLPISKEGNTIVYGMGGSGKEDLISTMLYSLMITHYKEEVNVYVLDFGAEVLNNYKSSPIIGDIINGNNYEKVNNFFKFLYKTFNERKKLFQDYNGSYLNYCSKSGKNVPNILVIINNYDNYMESLGEKFEETLIKVARDGEKYGIYFILTATSINSIAFRVSKNFKQYICLKMNDPYDYRSVLGNDIKVQPSNYSGRGLVNRGSIYEFQTALPVNTNDLGDYILQVSNNLLKNSNGKAMSIKTLPEMVDFEYVSPHLKDLHEMVIGVETESLKTHTFDFLNDSFNIITSYDEEALLNFSKSLIETISSKKETLKVILFDGNNNYDNLKENVTYISDNYAGKALSFIKFLDDVSEETKQSLVIFSGLKKMIESDENFIKIFEIILDKIKTINKINVVFLDNIKVLENYSREKWFNVDFDNGLWIGSGIDMQNLININKITAEMREEILSDYGYIISKGKALKIKLLNFFKEE